MMMRALQPHMMSGGLGKLSPAMGITSAVAGAAPTMITSYRGDHTVAGAGGTNLGLLKASPSTASASDLTLTSGTSGHWTLPTDGTHPVPTSTGVSAGLNGGPYVFEGTVDGSPVVLTINVRADTWTVATWAELDAVRTIAAAGDKIELARAADAGFDNGTSVRRLDNWRFASETTIQSESAASPTAMSRVELRYPNNLTIKDVVFQAKTRTVQGGVTNYTVFLRNPTGAGPNTLRIEDALVQGVGDNPAEWIDGFRISSEIDTAPFDLVTKNIRLERVAAGFYLNHGNSDMSWTEEGRATVWRWSGDAFQINNAYPARVTLNFNSIWAQTPIFDTTRPTIHPDGMQAAAGRGVQNLSVEELSLVQANGQFMQGFFTSDGDTINATVGNALIVMRAQNGMAIGGATAALPFKAANSIVITQLSGVYGSTDGSNYYHTPRYVFPAKIKFNTVDLDGYELRDCYAYAGYQNDDNPVPLSCHAGDGTADTFLDTFPNADWICSASMETAIAANLDTANWTGIDDDRWHLSPEDLEPLLIDALKPASGTRYGLTSAGERVVASFDTAQDTMFADGAVAGIGIYPPKANWTASQGGLTTTRSTALKASGFNTLRIWVDGIDQMDAYAAGGSALDDLIAEDIAYIQNAIDDGYAVVVSYAVDPAEPNRLNIQNPAGALYPRWLAICEAFGQALWVNFGNRVLFEPMNEFSTVAAISGAGYPDYYDTFCPAVVDAIRTSAPSLWVGLQSTDYGFATYLENFTDAGLLADERVVFAFHGYDPGEFSHQGQSGRNTFGINDLLWPVPATPGGLTQAIADMTDAVNASDLDSGDKTTQISGNTTILTNLFTAGGVGTPAYPLGLLQDAEDWRVANSIPVNRVLCTEFGAISEFNYDGTAGTTTEARAAYEQMWRRAIEGLGYGWMVYQAVGDFNHFEQTSVTVHGDTLIDDMMLALDRPGPAVTAPAWVQSYGTSGGEYPIAALDFEAGQYWFNNRETALDILAATEDRTSVKFSQDSGGVWRRIEAYQPAVTDEGLNIEAAFSGPTSTPLKVPTSASGPSTTFPSGFQIFGGGAGYTCAVVDDTSALASSGLAEIVPGGLVYEIVNTSGSTKYLQWQGGAISAVAQVGSWFARKISGAGNVALGKASGGGTGKTNIATSGTYTRYTFTDSGTNAMEIAIPNGVTFRFVLAMHEYKAALPPSSPITGSSRTKDDITMPSAIADAGLIQVDTGSGLVTKTAGELATMLDGGDVTIKAVVAWESV